MKHIKTFEGFVNESTVTIQPMDKVTGPDEKVIQLVGSGGVPVSYFWSNIKKGLVRSLAFAGNSETRILVKCKEDSGDQLIAQAIKDLGSKTWSDEMACTKEIEKYFKDNLKTFESVINEGAGDTVARDYEAILLSDVDFDDIYLSDDGVEWLDKTAKSFGDNKKVYMTNKEFVEQEGKDWKTLLQMLKSKNIKHAVLDDDEDSVVLFAR
jgi:hypothetical protein